MKSLRVIPLLFALMLPPALSAQAPPPPPRARAAAQRPAPKRDVLESQILNRFVNHAAQEMALDATQKGQLTQVVRASAVRRKQLNQRANMLNRRMQAAIRDQATSSDAFTRLLADHEQLRRDELQITETEQTELARFLTPRQQAHFLMLWIRLQENARKVQAQVPGGY